MDPYNIHILMEFKKHLLGIWTVIINITTKCLLSQTQEKSYCHTPYHPNWTRNSETINLSVIYLSSLKSTEKVTLLQLSAHFKDQNLLPTYQSAYCTVQ